MCSLLTRGSVFAYFLAHLDMNNTKTPVRISHWKKFHWVQTDIFQIFWKIDTFLNFLNFFLQILAVACKLEIDLNDFETCFDVLGQKEVQSGSDMRFFMGLFWFNWIQLQQHKDLKLTWMNFLGIPFSSSFWTKKGAKWAQNEGIKIECMESSWFFA